MPSMLRPLAILFAASLASVASVGCLSSSGSSPAATPGSDAGDLDANPPPVDTIDGSVFVDGGPAGFVTGLGSGQVERSAHYTLITKTGDEPGGAGLKSSGTYHLISGAGASAATK